MMLQRDTAFDCSFGIQNARDFAEIEGMLEEKRTGGMGHELLWGHPLVCRSCGCEVTVHGDLEEMLSNSQVKRNGNFAALQYKGQKIKLITVGED
jgi:hypothetical protein